jgi:hypothetical protein
MTPSLALRSERSAVSPEVAGELRDAMCRRQKELPARWLAAVDATALREGGALPSHEHESLERALGLALLRDQLPDTRPRGIVCIQPSATDANLALADALCQRGSVTSIGAAELDSKLAVEMIERMASRGIGESSSAVVCDYTSDLRCLTDSRVPECSSVWATSSAPRRPSAPSGSCASCARR